jgi:hypothetical protein
MMMVMSVMELQKTHFDLSVASTLSEVNLHSIEISRTSLDPGKTLRIDELLQLSYPSA